MTAAIHPPTGRIFFAGGDYAGPNDIASYRQEIWSLDLESRLAADDPATGWSLEYPYCGYGGTSVQPKSPDFIGWQYDSKRDVFWFVPGVMVGPVSAACPGRTTSSVSDLPNWIMWDVMTFDWKQTGPKRWATTGIGPGPDPQETWMSVLDPARDEVVRFGLNGGVGSVVSILNLRTRAWSQPVRGALNAVGHDIRIRKEPLAFDGDGRAVYAIDGVSGRLHRYRLDARVIDDLGPVPGGPLGIENYTIVSWDRKNQILLYAQTFRIPFGLYAYHPASRTWEALSIVTEPSGLPFNARTVIYHEGLNLHLLFGGVEPPNPYMFLYRYGEGTTPPGR